MAKRITLEIAQVVANGIVERAKEDMNKKNQAPDLQSNEPVSVTVVGPDGLPIVVLSMDGVMGVSKALSHKKAYTALMTQRETLFWESRGIDPRNFVDPNITCFGGGIPIKDRQGNVIGAIGVSGRKSHLKEKEIPGTKLIPQDHELAEIGMRHFIALFRKSTSKKSQQP